VGRADDHQEALVFFAASGVVTPLAEVSSSSAITSAAPITSATPKASTTAESLSVAKTGEFCIWLLAYIDKQFEKRTPTL
jgi:hypothetical protein